MELPVIHPSHEVLPPLYARWAEDFLPGPIPAETEATCDNCAMHDGETDAPAAGFFFDEVIKCCTFVPTLHNFIIGRILADNDPAGETGRMSVEKRLAEGVEITPLGAGVDPAYNALYAQMASAGAFGRSRHVRCPHYVEQTGACGIWRHREAVCSTWFCKHVRGEVAFDFWNLLKNMLGYLEGELVQWCVLQLDLGEPAFRRLFSGTSRGGKVDPIREGHLDGKPDAEIRRQIWGRWAGKEREFYLECTKLVEALSWDEVIRLAGLRAAVLLRLVEESYARLISTELPKRLEVSSFEMLRSAPDYSRVITHNACDPLEIPRAVIDVLHYFDGRPTQQALHDIAQERGLQLDETLVRKLADFRILVEPSQ